MAGNPCFTRFAKPLAIVEDEATQRSSGLPESGQIPTRDNLVLWRLAQSGAVDLNGFTLNTFSARIVYQVTRPFRVHPVDELYMERYRWPGGR
ncbi:hypothetical protein D7243_20580 [Stutzerimonas stutzeri]|nr:hypothetical protein [Stutzerimonas stutzeri]